MKRVALVFVLAVFVPSLVLAWLAVRSLRDQEFLLQRQQSLLYQGMADAVAAQVQASLVESQRAFSLKVSALLERQPPQSAADGFDDFLRHDWPLAQVGFVVNLSRGLVCPSPVGRPEAQTFCADYTNFLGCRETVEIYANRKESFNSQKSEPGTANANSANSNSKPGSQLPLDLTNNPDKKTAYLKQLTRNVTPMQQAMPGVDNSLTDNPQSISKLSASAAEFCELITTATDGTLARFVDNKLNVLFWCRPAAAPRLVFGAQLALPRLADDLRTLVLPTDPALQQEICMALLDDKAKPVALSRPNFHGVWKQPFVATEIGEVLPHWEVAVYLIDPAKLTRSAQTLKLTLSLLIALLLLAIGAGSWLIVTGLNRQLLLARQKTDFVSNVSHELKTPLTSIRMFSELLAEGRVAEPEKQRAYLQIITAETARLTRLINNVLDFARHERREQHYEFKPCDVAQIARETAASYRPHLEAGGFQFACEVPAAPITVQGDRDALAQVLVNLLSNAEKYTEAQKEILLRVEPEGRGNRWVWLAVLDRGMGVPAGREERIFEQFYRAHDSLSSGIPGSGLGLTLARQIARAHGGEVVYAPREGGGSIFTLRLPILEPGERTA